LGRRRSGPEAGPAPQQRAGSVAASMSLALYLATTFVLLFVWSRFVQRTSVAAALVLIALPLLFTGRALLTNRVYAPVDISFMAEPLRDYAKDYGVETPHNILLSDLHCQIIPWQKAVRYSLANGEWPLWNPFILAGDILAAAAQPAVYDPLQWLGMLIPLPDAFTFGAAMTFFLAGLFTFAFARALGLGEIASFAAAAGFMFCGMLAFFVGWPLGRAWVYLPLVLFATRERRFVLLTLAFVLVIVSGHPESVLHVVAVGAVYGLTTRPDLRTIGKAVLAGLSALAITAIYLLPFFEAVPQTVENFIRTELYATQTYDVLAPKHVQLERMKKTFVPGHRGPDPLSARVGIVVTLLAIAGVRKRNWFFAALAIVCLLATFGTWPVAHALHALPLFDIAINERLAFAAAFAMAILAAFAIDAMPKKIAIAVFALLLAERAWDDGRVYPALDKDAFFPRVPLIAAIPRDARMTAAAFAFTANNPTMYALEDVRGYQAMTFKRLYETYSLWSRHQTAYFNRVDDLSRPFLSFLNVRYAVGQGDPPEGWRLLAEDRGTRLFENTRELPRVFVPRRIRFERDGPTIVNAMQANHDFAEVAWIEAPELEPHDVANGPGSSIMLRRGGLAYDFDASMTSSGWVVISATAWKGWRAFVDGKRVETRFANHAFLAVPVPAGAHRVQLEYLPASFVLGRNISLAALALAAIFGFHSARKCLRSSSTSPRPPD
ncbi:MAG TPA: YfhO family protein, partial [Thermoanaerobaculia bacterium]|nr:YfhO family protein [Thermoanaerobaculia bacterium]